ncbi:hypothetical protein [Methylobacterium sp. A54F]
MIETLMVFGLGFLAASLCALLLLPALNARAKRLAQRRAAALMPLSAGEIAAEKDFLRAQFAVQQRRLERKVEAARAKRHADMAEVGARTLEIAALARDVEARDRTLSERDGEIVRANATRVRLEGELDTARDEGAAGLATLHALEDAHADLLDALLAARASASAGEKAATAPADLVAERDALRASLSVAEDALAQALSKGTEAYQRENAELRRRIVEVADAVTGRERLPAVAAFPAAARS